MTAQASAGTLFAIQMAYRKRIVAGYPPAIAFELIPDAPPGAEHAHRVQYS